MLVTLLEEHHRKHLATKSATGLDFTEVASKIRFPRRPPDQRFASPMAS
ncbi:hypothetical protein [Burkholderia pseudomallei]|nr:hypothetical protein [Burkholderia pseudomallei]